MKTSTFWVAKTLKVLVTVFCFCFYLFLFVFLLYVSVNNFSVILGWSHRFLGIYQYFGNLKVSCSRKLYGGRGVPWTSRSGVQSSTTEPRWPPQYAVFPYLPEACLVTKKFPQPARGNSLYRNDPIFSEIGLGKQCRPRSDCSKRSSVIRVFTVCYSICIILIKYPKLCPLCLNFR